MSIISDNSKLKFQCLVFSFSKECSLKNYLLQKKKKERKTIYLCSCLTSPSHLYRDRDECWALKKNNFLPEFSIRDFYR